MLPESRTAIPVDFALSHLKHAFTSLSEEEQALVEDILKCKTGTITARVRAMLQSAGIWEGRMSFYFWLMPAAVGLIFWCIELITILTTLFSSLPSCFS
jgi:hypothetical protein